MPSPLQPHVVSQHELATFREQKKQFFIMANFYQLSFNTLSGDAAEMEQFRGKKILIVNTASECGFTPQYCQLQELFEHFGGPDFEIIGFPCNDFGGQEPAENNDVKQFCERNYGVTFTMSEKVKVNSTPNHPVYQWLKTKSENGVDDFSVEWNFQKFLISETGELVKCLAPSVSPLDDEIINWLNQ